METIIITATLTVIAIIAIVISIRQKYYSDYLRRKKEGEKYNYFSDTESVSKHLPECKCYFCRNKGK